VVRDFIYGAVDLEFVLGVL